MPYWTPKSVQHVGDKVHVQVCLGQLVLQIQKIRSSSTYIQSYPACLAALQPESLLQGRSIESPAQRQERKIRQTRSPDRELSPDRYDILKLWHLD